MRQADTFLLQKFCRDCHWILLSLNIAFNKNFARPWLSLDPSFTLHCNIFILYLEYCWIILVLNAMFCILWLDYLVQDIFVICYELMIWSGWHMAYLCCYHPWMIVEISNVCGSPYNSRHVHDLLMNLWLQPKCVVSYSFHSSAAIYQNTQGTDSDSDPNNTTVGICK